MDIMEKMQEILKRSHVIMNDLPTFLYDTEKEKIVTPEENTGTTRYFVMNAYAFSTEEELDELIGNEGVVIVQKDSFTNSPWDFCKYVIRLKIIK